MRRGFVTAGTWCLDRNLTLDEWPREDTAMAVRGMTLAGGGSACNFAVDMRRLAPGMPVETQGLIGTGDAGDFLVGVADEYGIDRQGLHRSSDAQTQVTDAFCSAATGRRTHILHYGLAKALSPEHFDFSTSQARYLHLGLPGLHDLMDGPWEGEANGWVAVLRAARAQGIETNMELVAVAEEDVRRVVLPCLPHLDALVVNDYEIGALAGIPAVMDGLADEAAVTAAAQAVIGLGDMECVVVHHTMGAVLVGRDGEVISQPSVAIPREELKGANGAGDAFAAGFFYGRHEGWSRRECLKMGHAAAAACLRAAETYASVEDAETCLKLAERWGWRERG